MDIVWYLAQPFPSCADRHQWAGAVAIVVLRSIKTFLISDLLKIELLRSVAHCAIRIVTIAAMKPRPTKPSDPAHLTLEAWSQGMMVGTLVFMIMLTIANMRRKVLLHKLILIEVRRPILSHRRRLINT